MIIENNQIYLFIIYLFAIVKKKEFHLERKVCNSSKDYNNVKETFYMNKEYFEKENVESR